MLSFDDAIRSIFRNSFFKPDHVHDLLENSVINLLALYPFNYLCTLIKMWSSAENIAFIVYILHFLCQHHATSGPVTAVSNAVLETEIFCHRYLKINSSAV